MQLQRFVFNLYQALGSLDEEEVTYVCANDPIILLDQDQSFPRHTAQRARFPAAKTTVDDPVFGSSLEWAYNEYIVHRLWAPDERDDLRSVEATPMGNAPPQSVKSRSRPLQLAHARLLETLDRPASDADQRLYLFNVIVALEWLPSRPFLRQLEWAFRRASDLLYDVTNGCMAFGQVILADSDWMDCADVQIMASNRLLPRSWVSGLLDPDKYTPIRIGRGVWNRKPKIAIPWDEPEAYGTLVHEWAHYALGLRDEYLKVVSLEEALPHMLSSPIPIPREVYQRHYPRLKIPEQDLAGPGRLPLPLPSFHRIGRLAEQRDDQLLLTVPAQIEDESSWVYVLRGPLDQPQRITAQGTLDARSREAGFQLLGAEPGDTVILVEDTESRLKVWRGIIEGIGAKWTADIQDWQDATPDPCLLIDVQSNKLHNDTPVPDQAAQDIRGALKLEKQMIDGEWDYANVRQLFSYVEPSNIGLQKRVRPNDATQRYPVIPGSRLARWRAARSDGQENVLCQAGNGEGSWPGIDVEFFESAEMTTIDGYVVVEDNRAFITLRRGLTEEDKALGRTILLGFAYENSSLGVYLWNVSDSQSP